MKEKGAADDLPKAILTLSCPDQRGIVAAVSQFLFERGCNIIDSAQFGDRTDGQFYLRILFSAERTVALNELYNGFSTIAERFRMKECFYDAGAKTRTM